MCVVSSRGGRYDYIAINLRPDTIFFGQLITQRSHSGGNRNMHQISFFLSLLLFIFILMTGRMSHSLASLDWPVKSSSVLPGNLIDQVKK